MNKFYLSFILLFTIALLPFGSAAAFSSPSAVKARITPEEPSDMTLRFEYDGSGRPVINVEFKAPEKEKVYYGEPADLTIVDKIELLRRDAGTYDQSVITTFENVTPGAVVRYSDFNIEVGKEYEYGAIAYVGEDASSSWGIFNYVYAGNRPAAPAVTAETFEGSAPVTLTITAPDKTSGGDALEADLTQIKIFRAIGWSDDEQVATISYPEKGKTYEWVDEDYKNLTDGSTVTYSVYALTSSDTSEAASVTVYLIKDKPMSPENVSAVLADDSVLVSWDAVTEGVSGHWFDPKEVTYKVSRVTAGGGKTLLAQGLKETSFTDDLSDITTLNSYAWEVVAVNSQGESYGSTSGYLTIGPSLGLPFIETFNTPGTYSPTADNLWTEQHPEGYYPFGVENEMMLWISGYYDTYIYGYDNDDNTDKMSGFLAMDGSSWSLCESLYTSGVIDVSNNSKADLSFMYYVIPQSKSQLTVELIFDGNEKAQVVASLIPDGEALGWELMTVEKINLEGVSEVQIQFHGLTDPDYERKGIITPICIDNVSMVPASSSVEAVSDAEVAEIEYFSLSGLKLDNPAKGTLVIRCEKLMNGETRYTKVIL